MMIDCCEQLEINTKDICLLCLESKVEVNGFDLPPTVASLQGLKHLLRYLKVSPKELFNCSTEFLQSMTIREDIDLKISLCPGCASVTEKFNQLYQEYEVIQLQFGGCVQSLHESMSNGNENPERVRKYMDQMRPKKSADLVNASIAANLRSETLKKCSLKLQSVTPKVRITSENVNAEKCAKIPIVVGVKSCSGSSKIQVPVENTFIRDSRFGKSEVESQFSHNAEKSKFTNASPQPESCLALVAGTRQGPRPNLCLEMSTETFSDIEVVAEVKRVETNMNRKTGYFSSIRKRLKSQRAGGPTISNSTSTQVQVNVPPFDRNKVSRCEHCEVVLSSQESLQWHMLVTHPELFIIKLLPSHVSLELCKHSVHAIWKQMFEVTGTKCQFCKLKVTRPRNLKRHLVVKHPETLAAKVLENIQLTDGVIPNDTGNNHARLSTTEPSVKNKLACEYCDLYFSSLSIKNHKLCVHPENIVYKFFPPHIPLESCKQGVDVVLKQILNQDTESGHNKCKFCPQTIVRKDSFKIHVVSMHADQIAIEAQQIIFLSSKHLEVVSTEALACSSTMRTHLSEDINESNELSVPVEMDFEEESLVKIENPPPEDVELDPLDLN